MARAATTSAAPPNPLADAGPADVSMISPNADTANIKRCICLLPKCCSISCTREALGQRRRTSAGRSLTDVAKGVKFAHARPNRNRRLGPHCLRPEFGPPGRAHSCRALRRCALASVCLALRFCLGDGLRWVQDPEARWRVAGHFLRLGVGLAHVLRVVLKGHSPDTRHALRRLLLQS